MKVRVNPVLASASDEAFIEAAYQTVLGRPSDTGEKQYQASRLSQGASRSQVIKDLREEATRHGSSAPTAETAVATLLFTEYGRFLAPVIAECASAEQPDRIWRVAEEVADSSASILSEDQAKTIFGGCPGWINECRIIWLNERRCAEISGFIFGLEPITVAIYVNRAFVGSAGAFYYNGSDKAWVQAVRFRFVLDEARLEDFNLNTIAAKIDGISLWPADRAHIPWLARTIWAMTALRVTDTGLAELHAFQKWF